jgi:hypothetical protein
MSLGNQICAALAFLCLVVLVRCTTARGFRFSPALLFFILFILQQIFGCMMLLREDDPGAVRAFSSGGAADGSVDGIGRLDSGVTGANASPFTS